MIKEKNEETGEVKVIFSSEEFKKLKIFGGAAAVLLILSISLAGWAGYSTNALHAENDGLLFFTRHWKTTLRETTLAFAPTRKVKGKRMNAR